MRTSILLKSGKAVAHVATWREKKAGAMTEAKRDAWSDVSLVPVRRCAVCGKPFAPGSKKARYCSLPCRDEAKRERNREWRARHPKVDSYCPFRGDVADEINRLRSELGM